MGANGVPSLVEKIQSIKDTLGDAVTTATQLALGQGGGPDGPLSKVTEGFHAWVNFGTELARISWDTSPKMTVAVVLLITAALGIVAHRGHEVKKVYGWRGLFHIFSETTHNND